MFYFLLNPILTYNFILIAAAVIPAVFLLLRVYRTDRLERESPRLLRRLVVMGVLSSLLALLEERIFSAVLASAVAADSPLYNVLLYFVVVAVSEESSKYLLLKRSTWKSPEFNCQYDGVVYAIFVSLGFALWENISYVMNYGFRTAIVRAVTAIPGHACFGVFMGVFYGLARKYENFGRPGAAKTCRVLSVLVPVGLHGAYDYIVTVDNTVGSWAFFGFIAILFFISYRMVGKAAQQDQFIA